MAAKVAKGNTTTGTETVAGPIDRWLARCDSIGRSSTALRPYRSIAENVRTRELGEVRLSDLTAGDLDRLDAKLTAKGDKAATVRRVPTWSRPKRSNRHSPPCCSWLGLPVPGATSCALCSGTTSTGIKQTRGPSPARPMTLAARLGREGENDPPGAPDRARPLRPRRPTTAPVVAEPHRSDVWTKVTIRTVQKAKVRRSCTPSTISPRRKPLPSATTS